MLWQSGEGNQIYGNERLYSEGSDSETIYLYGLHNSVYGYLTKKDGKETIRKQRYDDFGYAKGIGSGYGYNGEFRDESELIYLRARYYHPKIGRFIQIDSFKGDTGSIESQNRYIYTQNNPYKYTDPSGNELLEDFDFRDKYKPNSVVQLVLNTAENLSNLFFDPKTKTFVSMTQTQRVVYAANQIYQSGVTETCVRAGIEPVILDLPVPCPQPDWTEDFLDGLQTILDWGGIIPGIGDILDLLNAVIYYARGMMIDAVISVGCVIFSVVADTLLKPLRWAAKSVDDLAAKIVKKIPDFASSVNKAILKAADKIASQKWIPKWIREKVAEIAISFTIFVESTFDKAATYVVGDAIVEGVGKASDKLVNGSKMTTNEALDAAEDFLGKGYKDLGNGRFVSADGTKQVRMGDSDILGNHGGGPHMNFETLAPNPYKPGKMMIIENLHIYLID